MRIKKPFATAFWLSLGIIAARVLLFAGIAASIYFINKLGAS